MSFSDNGGGASRAGFWARHGCTLQGWVVGWAVAVFASATIQTIAWESHRGLDGWAGAIFQTADAVPPAAKLVLGALIAGGLAGVTLVPKRRAAEGVPPAGAVAACVVAMAIALALPVSYYPVGRTGGAGLFALHLAAAAFGGLVLWLTARGCRRRRERKP